MNQTVKRERCQALCLNKNQCKNKINLFYGKTPSLLCNFHIKVSETKNSQGIKRGQNIILADYAGLSPAVVSENLETMSQLQTTVVVPSTTRSLKMVPINLLKMMSQFKNEHTQPLSSVDKLLYFQLNYIVDRLLPLDGIAKKSQIEKLLSTKLNFKDYLYTSLSVDYGNHTYTGSAFTSSVCSSVCTLKDGEISLKDDVKYNLDTPNDVLINYIGEIFLTINTVSLLQDGTVDDFLYKLLIKWYKSAEKTVWNRKLLVTFARFYNKKNQRETKLSLSYRCNLLFNKVVKIVSI